MAVALVSSIVSQGTSGAVTSSAIDTTGATLLVLVLISYASATESTISDSKGNTWTQRTAYINGTLERTRIYYCASPTVGSGHTFAASGTGSFPAIAVSAYSGTAASSPYDVEAGTQNSSTTSKATGSVTPSQNGDLLVVGAGFGSVGAPVSPAINSSFNVLGSVGNVNGVSFGVCHGYYVQPTAGAINPTISWTTASSIACSITGFKQSSGGLLLPRGFDGGLRDQFVGGFAG